MCIKIKEEHEYVISLEADTISGRQRVDISKTDIVKNAKQLIDTAYDLLEILDSDTRDSEKYQDAMNLLQEAVEALEDA